MFSGIFPIEPCPDGTFFIDRNPTLFPMILDFIRGEDIDTEELSAKEQKQLLKEAQYYHVIELEQVMTKTKVSNYAWTNGAGATITENGKRATAQSSSCFVYVNEPIKTIKKQSIKLSVDTKSNAWIHICLSSQKSFPSLGNCYPSQQGKIPFMYHVNYGQINNVSGFPQKSVATVELIIENKAVTVSVDGAKQTGSWNIPEEVYLLVDPYHTGTTVLLH